MAGNANSGRKQEKPFRDALRMEISKAGSKAKSLRNIARKLIDMAEEGNMAAIRELADRTDGKVPMNVEGDEENPIIHEVRWIIANPDGD